MLGADDHMGKQEHIKLPPNSPEGDLIALRNLVQKQQEELELCCRIECSLRESYRFLVENSGDIIWRIDLQGLLSRIMARAYRTRRK